MHGLSMNEANMAHVCVWGTMALLLRESEREVKERERERERQRKRERERERA